MNLKRVGIAVIVIIIVAIALLAIMGAPPADPCAEVACSENQKCVEGECVLKTCEEQGENICTEAQTCEQLVEASDSEACCAVECRAVAVDPCEGVECLEGEECVEGECVAIDLCVGVECPEEQQCVDGNCVAIEG